AAVIAILERGDTGQSGGAYVPVQVPQMQRRHAGEPPSHGRPSSGAAVAPPATRISRIPYSTATPIFAINGTRSPDFRAFSGLEAVPSRPRFFTPCTIAARRKNEKARQYFHDGMPGMPMRSQYLATY